MARKPSPLSEHLFQGKRLSKERKEYNKQVRNLWRRIKSWEKEHGFIVELPELPKRDFLKHAEKLKNIRYKEITDIDQKQLEYVESGYVDTLEQAERYGYRGAPLSHWAKMNPDKVTKETIAKYPEIEEALREEYGETYHPKSENEWVERPEPGVERDVDYDEYEETPSVDEWEIDAWLNSIRAEIADWEQYVDDSSSYQSTRNWLREIAQQNQERVLQIWDSAVESAKRAMYERFKNTALVDQLTTLVQMMYGIKYEDKYGNQSNGYLNDIARLLKGSPLTDEEMFSLSSYGTVDFSDLETMT